MKATKIIAELTALVLEHGPEIEVEVRNAAGDLDAAGCIWLETGSPWMRGRLDDGKLRAIIDTDEKQEDAATRRRNIQ